MSMRVILTVDVQALSEQEAIRMVENRLRTPDFGNVEFIGDAEEIDDTPSDDRMAGQYAACEPRDAWNGR